MNYRRAVIGLVLISTVIFGSVAWLPSVESSQSSDPAIFWNQVTTQLAQGARLNPVRLARAYALVHVAIYDSVLGSMLQDDDDLSHVAVAAGSASQVLTYLFPANASFIEEKVQTQVESVNADPGIVASSLSFGRSVGTMVMTYARNDGSSAVFTGPIPTGDCIWTGVNPVEPMAGTWKTWILKSGAEVQPEPPYPCGSQADLQDVQAAIDASLALTPERIAIVRYWADPLAPTIWNNILNQVIESRGMGFLRSAKAHAYLSIAMYDGLVSTWLAKYTYWTARPFQRIANFSTVVRTPNFPGYISAHATVSGAASVVLGRLFPDQADYFAGQADEAALSRLWGGIHFPQDDDQGLVVGRTIGYKTVQDMVGEPHTFVFPMQLETLAVLLLPSPVFTKTSYVWELTCKGSGYIHRASASWIWLQDGVNITNWSSVSCPSSGSGIRPSNANGITAILYVFARPDSAYSRGCSDADSVTRSFSPSGGVSIKLRASCSGNYWGIHFSESARFSLKR